MPKSPVRCFISCICAAHIERLAYARLLLRCFWCYGRIVWLMLECHHLHACMLPCVLHTQRLWVFGMSGVQNCAYAQLCKNCAYAQLFEYCRIHTWALQPYSGLCHMCMVPL